MLAGSIFSAILLIIYHFMFSAKPDDLTRTVVQRSWTGRQVGLLLAGFILMSIILSAVQMLSGGRECPVSQLATVLLFSASQLLILQLIGRERKRGWVRDFGMDPGKLKLLPLALGIYLSTIFGLGFVTMIYHKILEQSFGMEVDMQAVVVQITSSQSWLKVGYILLAVVVAPLYEEMIFRGVLFAYLLRRGGLALAMVAVSLLFALLHFHIPSMAPLFLLSVVLCLTYWRTGSLWVNIGVHALFNGATITFLLVMN